jgi:hypothetical protein
MRHFISFTSLLWISLAAHAQEASPNAPSLGWSVDAQRHELVRLDGVPGSLALERSALPQAERVWASASLLVLAKGEVLEVFDLRGGATRTARYSPGDEIAFSANGRHFVSYSPGEAAPLVLNSGETFREPGVSFSAATEFQGQVLLASQESELVVLEPREGGWREVRRSALPVRAKLRSLHADAEGFLLLTRDGDLLRWSSGEAEATVIATEVRSFAVLEAPGFYRFEDSRGPHLYYPASLGQKVYELPGAKSALSTPEQR